MDTTFLSSFITTKTGTSLNFSRISSRESARLGIASAAALSALAAATRSSISLRTAAVASSST
jgi:hypothetical protein